MKNNKYREITDPSASADRQIKRLNSTQVESIRQVDDSKNIQ